MPQTKGDSELCPHGRQSAFVGRAESKASDRPDWLQLSDPLFGNSLAIWPCVTKYAPRSDLAAVLS